MRTFYLAIKLFKLINKKFFYLAMFFSFLTIVLETIGIALIIPILEVVVNGKIFNFLNTFFLFFNIDILNLEKNKIIIYMFIFIIFFYFFKLLFILNLIYVNNKLIFYFKSQISKYLFRKYLFEDISFYSKIHTSILVRNITKELDNTMGVLISSISFIIESMLIVGISILIIIYTPISIVPILLIFIVAYFFVRLSTKKVKLWGEQRQKLDKDYLEIIFNSMNGIKEIKIYSSENYFLKKYNSLLIALIDISNKVSILRSLPKHIFEFLGIFIISLVIIINFLVNDSAQSIIPILGLFAASAFRILPSANKILSDLNVFKFSYPSIDLIYNEIFKIKNKQDNFINFKKINFEDKIKIKNLDFSYNGNDIFKKLNFEIIKGDFIGIKGESGIGKTTFANLLVGLIKPNNGEILIDNINILSDESLFFGWKRKIAYVPQEIFLLRETLRKNVAFGLDDSEIDDKKVLSCLNKSSFNPKIISDAIDPLNGIISEKGISVSGGQKQRLGIARALYMDSEVLIFDESTSSLDPATEKEILKTIKEISEDKTIIIISHKETSLAQCNKIYNLISGKLELLK
jgi:ABC-type multidrug transport system fused ATPase/permease subunit